MTDTANHLVPEQGKLRRALAVVFSWLQAMEYTSFDYTLDRIERLEREVGQSWSRSFEQDSAKVKWTAARVGPLQFRAAENSCRRREGRWREVGLVRGAPVKARMRAPMIVKGQIATDRAARLADAIVGSQVDLLVFDASPQALDERGRRISPPRSASRPSSITA